jgi:hypothetical protein
MPRAGGHLRTRECLCASSSSVELVGKLVARSALLPPPLPRPSRAGFAAMAQPFGTVEPALGYDPPPWRPPVRRRRARTRSGTAAFHRRCSAWRRQAIGCRRDRCVRGRRWRRRSRPTIVPRGVVDGAFTASTAALRDAGRLHRVPQDPRLPRQGQVASPDPVDYPVRRIRSRRAATPHGGDRAPPSGSTSRLPPRREA